jgi:hypothetical protein
MEPGKTLLTQALALIAAHPAMRALPLTSPLTSVSKGDFRQ